MAAEEDLTEERRVEDNKSRLENTQALVANTASNEAPDSNGTLITAVQELTQVVKALQETMNNYPDRRELRRDYATRKEIRSRRVGLGLAMSLAIIASYFATINTVNYCFLNGIPDPGERAYCQIFPGYEESFDNNREQLAGYQKLIKQIQQNQIDIKELKARP